MIHCIAIDDEPKSLTVIGKHVDRVPFLHLDGTFVDPFAAIEFLQNHPVDLVFLDINMPDITGLQLVHNLPGSPLIIFTTAHSEYALQSYELEAVDYLLKPFDLARFLKAVNKVKSRLEDQPDPIREFFFINTGNQKQRLFFKDIQYILGDGNYVRYHIPGNNYLVRATIKETLQQLPAPQFVQIHRSAVVALAWVEKVEDHHVSIAGQRLSVSGTYREGFYRLIG